MTESDTYQCIKQRSAGVFRDRGSKFLAYAFPVTTTEEIKNILGELKKQYHDARHLCYAYRLGAAKEIYRTNDDGEPSGSAGKSILGQIQANDLSDILIVVIRYFGGTLLGVGGLRNAYRSAAANAIQDAKIITLAEQDQIEACFPYSMMNEVMKIVRENNMKIREQDFSETCRIHAFIRKSLSDQVLKRLSGLKETSARIL